MLLHLRILIQSLIRNATRKKFKHMPSYIHRGVLPIPPNPKKKICLEHLGSIQVPLCRVADGYLEAALHTKLFLLNP
jgi:hypothetical protein